MKSTRLKAVTIIAAIVMIALPFLALANGGAASQQHNPVGAGYVLNP